MRVEYLKPISKEGIPTYAPLLTKTPDDFPAVDRRVVRFLTTFWGGISVLLGVAVSFIF